MIELLFADCNCQSLTKKFPLRCQKFPHSSQISSQISVGFANFVDMGTVVIKYNIPSALVESQELLSLTCDSKYFHEVQCSMRSLIAQIYTVVVQRI